MPMEQLLKGPKGGPGLFFKVSSAEMGKLGDKKTNHFVFIYLNKFLNNPLCASTENATVRRPLLVSFRSVLVSRGEIYTPSSILEGYVEIEIKCYPLHPFKRKNWLHLRQLEGSTGKLKWNWHLLNPQVWVTFHPVEKRQICQKEEGLRD